MSNVVDRLCGVSGGLAIKAPARFATTAPITLSGLQAVDGSTVTLEGDRVVVRRQSTATENGIYNASSGAWTRALDFDGARDVVAGTCVLVTEGTAFAGVEFVVTTPNPILIGTTAIVFDARGLVDLAEDGSGPTGPTGPDGSTGSDSSVVLPTDPAADCTPAIQSAIDLKAAAGGGIVRLPSGLSRDIPILTNLTVRTNVSLEGQAAPGFIEYDLAPPAAGQPVVWKARGRLLVASTATIKLEPSSSVRRCHVLRASMLNPETSAAAYAGTAFTVKGDDVTIADCTIIGFNLAVTSSGYARWEFSNIKWDCLNGFYLKDTYDISRLSHCHGWPAGTIPTAYNGAVQPALSASHFLFREGTAYFFAGRGDWLEVDHCFSYGFRCGFHLQQDVASGQPGPTLMTVSNCATDNINWPGSTPVLLPGTIGLIVEGYTGGNMFTNCRFVAQSVGIYDISNISGAPALRNYFNNCQTEHCVTGYSAGATATSVLVDCKFSGVEDLDPTTFSVGVNVSPGGTVRVVRPSVSYVDVSFAGNNGGGLVVENPAYVTGQFNQMAVVPIGSGEGLPIVNNRNLYKVTGSTNFGTIPPSYAGHEVTLIIDGAFSIASGQSLRLASTFAATHNSTLTLVFDGAHWLEKGRSLNDGTA